MTAVYAVGDATNPPGRPCVIAHVVNDAGVFGAGFAKALAARWPGARSDYLRWHREGLHLGGIRLTWVADGLWVAHLAAQHGLGRRHHPLRLDALEKCLGELAAAAEGHAAEVVMPRIGTGFGGGSWDEVRPLVERLALSLPVTVYDLPKESAR